MKLKILEYWSGQFRFHKLAHDTLNTYMDNIGTPEELMAMPTPLFICDTPPEHPLSRPILIGDCFVEPSKWTLKQKQKAAKTLKPYKDCRVSFWTLPAAEVTAERLTAFGGQHFDKFGFLPEETVAGLESYREAGAQCLFCSCVSEFEEFVFNDFSIIDPKHPGEVLGIFSDWNETWAGRRPGIAACLFLAQHSESIGMKYNLGNSGFKYKLDLATSIKPNFGVAIVKQDEMVAREDPNSRLNWWAIENIHIKP